jgi:F-type H+-transporting ATPase subunit b
MIDIDISFFIQLANFLIIWMVLNLILLRPIRGVIKKRAEFMANEADAIDKFSTQAVTKVQDYEAALDTARKAGVEERTRLKDEGLATEADLVGAASKDAAAEMAAARTAVEADFAKALEGLKPEVDKLATKAVGKILA